MNLAAAICAAGPLVVRNVHGINDDGVILLEAIDQARNTHALVLTPGQGSFPGSTAPGLRSMETGRSVRWR